LEVFTAGFSCLRYAVCGWGCDRVGSADSAATDALVPRSGSSDYCLGGEVILSTFGLSSHLTFDQDKMANNEESRGLMSLFDWFANRRKSGPISRERQERDIADNGVFWLIPKTRANQMVLGMDIMYG